MVNVVFYNDTLGITDSTLMSLPKTNVVHTFGGSVNNAGDTFEKLPTYGDAPDYALILGAIPISIADVHVQVPEGKTLKKVVRYNIIEAQKKAGKQTIVIESGLLGPAYNVETRDIKIGSCRVGLGHNLPNLANFKNQNSPSDRWEKLNLEMKPWRTTGDHIVICLQRDGSFAVRDMDQFEWLQNTVNEIKLYSDRPIIVRTKDITCKNKIESMGMKISLDDAVLYSAWAAVVMSSTIDIKLVLNGIPTFTTTNRAFTYPLGNHLLSNIEYPLTPDREQLFYNIAYAQWTIEEMKEGLAWNHIKCH